MAYLSIAWKIHFFAIFKKLIQCFKIIITKKKSDSADVPEVEKVAFDPIEDETNAVVDNTEYVHYVKILVHIKLIGVFFLMTELRRLK